MVVIWMWVADSRFFEVFLVVYLVYSEVRFVENLGGEFYGYLRGGWLRRYELEDI